MFLSFASMTVGDVDRAMRWIMRFLEQGVSVDLEALQIAYELEFPLAARRAASPVTIVHLSDLHLGSAEASIRTPRLEELVSNLMSELRARDPIVVLSGDLMNTPSKDISDRVRQVVNALGRLCDDRLVLVWGNHDVRKAGILWRRPRPVMELPCAQPLRWFDDLKVGFLSFNSALDGVLARGTISERQLLDIGNGIDRKKNWRDYALFMVVHHHPLPVDIPTWYSPAFYERVLGGQFERTEELEGADTLIKFGEARSAVAILHGHKHIPRLTRTEGGVAVVGCGSSVGKVRTTDRSPYLSLNVVRFDTKSRQLSVRLLAERVSGGGLTTQERHEIIHRQHLPTNIN